jgi:membrane associated rhomboid family serine protease
VSSAPVAPPRCYVHGDRPAGSVCRRCGRPICPECMREAPVGWQCKACVPPGEARTPRRPGRLGATRITPVVAGLIAVNVAVYLWEQGNLTAREDRFAMWPIGVHYYHQWYRLVTAAFLHASVEHILFNMVTLAIVGPPVEAEIGKGRFFVLYMLSAVGGSVASYLLSPANEAGIGASGAIFGVMGAYYVIARRRGWELRTITALVAINLLLSLTSPGIDWRAHLGGLLTGVAACAGLLAAPRGASATRASPFVQGVQTAAVTIAVMVVLGALVQLPPGHVNL